MRSLHMIVVTISVDSGHVRTFTQVLRGLWRDGYNIVKCAMKVNDADRSIWHWIVASQRGATGCPWKYERLVSKFI